MNKEEMNRCSRQQCETLVEIREENVSLFKSYHCYKRVIWRYYRKDYSPHKRHLSNKKEMSKQHGDRHLRDDRSSNSVGRREWRDRNSPVQLIVRGCRNTDSSSPNFGDDHSPGKEKHYSKRRKEDQEESFEKLSLRKRKIESLLKALDAEEAAARKERKLRHKTTRKRPKRSIHRLEEKAVKIKQETLSDGGILQRLNGSTETGRQQDNFCSRNGYSNLGRCDKQPAKMRQKPNFQTSGKLSEDTNTYNGALIKYNEPSKARKPKLKWRLYPFQGDESLPFIPIHRQSAYSFGRSPYAADIPIEHPSCSNQHAVLQFLLLPYERKSGEKSKSVRPYVIDLGSSNGTYVNDKKIDSRRYVELFEKDILKFGSHTREYVLLHEGSKDEDEAEVICLLSPKTSV